MGFGVIFDNDDGKQFIFRHVCPYNIKRSRYSLRTMLKTVLVHQEKQYKFYNHNLSNLFQYLCITLVIKKLYEFEINTFDHFLNLFIKLNVNFLLEGGKFKTSQIFPSWINQKCVSLQISSSASIYVIVLWYYRACYITV